MTRFLRSTALAAAVLSAPALGLASTGAFDDAGLSAERATATVVRTGSSADGLSPGTSHDDATYAPAQRPAPATPKAAQADGATRRPQMASNCTCGHRG